MNNFKLLLLALTFFSSTVTFAQNQALSLTGNNNELNINYNLSTNDGFTIKAWINVPTLDQQTYLINQTDTITGGLGGDIAAPLDIQLNTDGSITLVIGDGTNTPVSATTASGLIAAATWHHIAVGYEGDFSGVTALYVDGSPTPVLTLTNTLVANAGPIRVGRRADGADGNDFLIDELQIGTGFSSGSQSGYFINGDYDKSNLENFGFSDVFLNFEGNLNDLATTDGSQNAVVIAGTATYPAGPALDQNNALAFDGTDDFIDIGLTYDEISSYTKEAWIKPAQLTGIQNIITNTDGSGDAFRLNSGNLEAGHGGTFNDVSAPFPNDGEWHHVAVSYDEFNFELILYIDGQAVDFGNTGDSSGGATTIGSLGGASEFFQGEIDEVRIWNNQRFQDEIIDNAYLTLDNEPSLLVSYDFDEGTPGGNNTGEVTLRRGNFFDGSDGTLNGFTLTGSTSNWVASTAFVNDVFAPRFNAYSISFDPFNTLLDVNINEPGEVRYVILLDDATPEPTIAEILAGTGTAGATPAASGAITVTSPSTQFSTGVTGLSPATSYRLFLVAQDDETIPNIQQTFEFFSYTTTADFTTIADGNWSDPTIWDNGVIPNSGGNVTISNNITLDITDANVGDFTLSAGSLFDLNGNNLNVSGNYSVVGSAFTANGGKVTLDGANQNYNHTGDITYFDLEFAGSGTKTIEYFSNNVLFITDSLLIGPDVVLSFNDTPEILLNGTSSFSSQGSISSTNKWSLIVDGTSHTILGGDFNNVSWQIGADVTLLSDFNYDTDFTSFGDNLNPVNFNIGSFEVNLGTSWTFSEFDTFTYTTGGRFLTEQMENNVTFSMPLNKVPLIRVAMGGQFFFNANSDLEFDTDQLLLIESGIVDLSFTNVKWSGTSGGINLTGGELSMFSASYTMNDGATLSNDGGIVDVSGSLSVEGTPFSISSDNASSFNITQLSGSMNISEGSISGIGGLGLSVIGGDLTVSNLDFDSGVGLSYLYFNADIGEKTYQNVTFTSGATNNVTIADGVAQVVNFTGSIGDFGGPDFASPGTTGTINWPPPPTNDGIYLSTSSSISKTALDGTSPQVIASTFTTYGIDLDRRSGTLYFIEPALEGTDRIYTLDALAVEPPLEGEPPLQEPPLEGGEPPIGGESSTLPISYFDFQTMNAEYAGLAIDTTNAGLEILVVDSTNNSILRILDGVLTGTFTNVGTGINDLEIYNGTAYWTSTANSGDIWSAPTDDLASASILISFAGDGLYGLAIDPEDSKIYWSGPVGGFIRRANLDGTNTEVFKGEILGISGDIEIDYENRRLLMVERGFSEIFAYNLSDASQVGTGAIYTDSFESNITFIHASSQYTPPVLAPVISDLFTTPENTDVSVSITVSSQADLYYVISTSDTPPTENQIFSGLDGDGNTAFNAGNFGSITGSQTFGIGEQGLATGSTYTIFWVAESGGLFSNILSETFTTLTPVNVTFTENPVTSSDLVTGSTNNLVYSFSLNADSPLIFNGIIIEFDVANLNLETAFQGINPISLWKNSVSSFTAGDPQQIGIYGLGGEAGGRTLIGNEAGLELAEEFLPANQTVYYFVTADISPEATIGNEVKILPRDLSTDLGLGDALVTGTSAGGSVFTIIADTKAPIITIDLLRTNVTSPTITGTIDEIDASLILEVDGTSYEVGTINPDSTWSLASGVLPDLGEGSYNIIAIAVDADGNQGTDATVDELIIDTTAPTVTGITRVGPAITNSTDLEFEITFSEEVSGVELGDFALVTGGDVSAVLGSVTPLDQSKYTVSVSSVAGNGTLGLSFVSSASNGVIDLAENNSTEDFTTSQLYSIDNIGASASIIRKAPTTELTNVGNVLFEVQFSQEVINVDVTDFILSGTAVGEITSLSASGNTSYDVSVAVTAEGTLGLAFDEAQNIVSLSQNNYSGILTTEEAYTIDQTAPTVVISTTATSPTNATSIPVTIEFSEAVTGFTIDSLTLSNATASNFAGSATSYTVDISPTAGGDFGLSVTLGKAVDVAGNPSVASNTLTLTSDQAAPTVTISTAATSPTNATSIPVTIEFSEAVTGFTIDSLTLSNATASNFAGSGTSYTVDISPTAGGDFGLSVTLGKAVDVAGNPSVASNTLTLTSDQAAPTVTISTAATSPTNATSIPVTIEFSEAVTGFTIDSLTLSNATASNFAGSGTSYIVDVSPTSEGDFSISVGSGKAVDAASNPSVASNTITLISDQTSPTVVLSTTTTSPTNATSIPVTIEFSEAVTGFTIDSLTLSNGTASNFAGSGTSYTVYISPTAEGDFSVSIGSGKAVDAAGNPSEASNTITLISDQTSPTVVLSTTTTSPTNATSIPVTIEFSKAVTGFTIDSLTLSNGTASNFAGSGTSYTVAISPTAEGDFSVSVGSGKAVDAAGNPSEASNTITLISDQTSPTVVLSTTTTSPTNATSIPVTIEFSEAVTAFTIDSLTLINATASNFAGSGTSYTVAISPTAEGDFSVSVGSGKAVDAAGNPSEASNTITLISDQTSPTVVLSTTTTSPTNATSIPVTIEFSEAVTDFTIDSLTLINATASNFTGSGTSYTVDISPTAEGDFSVSVGSGKAVDAAGNPSVTSNTLTLTSDQTAPTVTIIPLSTLSDSPALSGTVDDNAASIALTVEGETYSAVNNADGTWTLSEGTITSLAVGTYEVAVTATDVVDNVGSDNTTNELTIQPGAPRATAATDVDFFSFTANWTARAGVSGYRLDVSTDANFVDLLSSYDNLSITALAVTVSEGIQYDTKYYYRVRALYPSGDVSPSSNTIEVTTPLDAGTTADKNALLAIYNATGGSNWTRQNNWSSDLALRFWDDVTMTGTRVTGVSLNGNNLAGSFPIIEGEALGALVSLNLQGNQLTSLPDLTALTALTSLDVSGNKLQFGTLEPNASISGITYSPQQAVLSRVNTLRQQETTYEIDRTVTGTSNTYAWKKRNLSTNAVTEITNTGSTYSLEIVDFSSEGAYYAEVTNPSVAELTLTTAEVVVKVSSLERDFAALQNIFDGMNGADWSNVNWGSETDQTQWTGVEFTANEDRVIGLSLPNANMRGDLPEDILDIAGLATVNLSGNRITSIPDFSSLTNLTSLNVAGNNLEFDDLEPNMDLAATIDYSAQRRVAVTKRDTIRVGTSTEVSVSVGGSANSYVWTRSNDVDTVQLATRAGNFSLDNISYETMGVFVAAVTNENVPNLTLTTRTQQVLAFADLTFKAVDLDGNFYTDGTGYALRVTLPGNPYDTIQTVAGGAGQDGQAFEFRELILGDYLIAVGPNVLRPFLPTYFPSTDQWTEAEEFILRDDGEQQLNMAQIPPPPPEDPDAGVVQGLVEADFEDEQVIDEDGARISARRKVRKAGCSMRKFVGSGRPSQEEGRFELYAYVESDDEGRFSFTDIESGLYRFNIEYPGIPMDTTSFVEFEIGDDGVERNSFTLEATVTEDGIAVEKIEELGFYRKYFKDLSVYPNPSDKEMKITYAKMLAKGVIMRLVDLSGHTMYEQAVEPGYNGEVNIDVRDVPSGVYLLNFVDTIKGVGTVVTYKVFVRH